MNQRENIQKIALIAVISSAVSVGSFALASFSGYVVQNIANSAKNDNVVEMLGGTAILGMGFAFFSCALYFGVTHYFGGAEIEEDASVQTNKRGTNQIKDALTSLLKECKDHQDQYKERQEQNKALLPTLNLLNQSIVLLKELQKGIVKALDPNDLTIDLFNGEKRDQVNAQIDEIKSKLQDKGVQFKRGRY
ncbi:MAG: hypothetical protein HAW62_02245 [Endozoicomonadaceae bacterium]|nr:hypothetical protein [Endozoicomonadaceae bacterium]